MKQPAKISEPKKLHLLENKIDALNLSFHALKEQVEIKGKEVDQLQIEANKPKKWWKNDSSLISIIAVLISFFSTFYTIKKENQKELTEQKLRVNEIVQRLSEIQTLYANAGTQLGGVQQSTFAEVSNMVDEAISISEKNGSLLNDAEYSTIIAAAFMSNKTENLETLFDKALATVNDLSTEYSIRNYQANYYYLIKNQPEYGRIIIKDLISKSENQKVSPDMKKANIANEYAVWSGFELQIGNYEKADSLLKIAEEMVVNGADSWRFTTYPVTQNVKNYRNFFNNRKSGKQPDSVSLPSSGIFQKK